MAKIKDLINNGFNSINKQEGIYIVKTPKDFKVNFTFNMLNKTCPCYCIKDLADKYNKTMNKEILYIGKSVNLRKRIKQYINYGLNKNKIHKGGRAIFQIQNYTELEIEYYYCASSKDCEKQSLKNYLKNNGVLPLANWTL